MHIDLLDALACVLLLCVGVASLVRKHLWNVRKGEDAVATGGVALGVSAVVAVVGVVSAGVCVYCLNELIRPYPPTTPLVIALRDVLWQLSLIGGFLSSVAIVVGERVRRNGGDREALAVVVVFAGAVGLCLSLVLPALTVAAIVWFIGLLNTD